MFILRNLSVKKNTIMATMGSILECYDFVIYAAMIPYLSQSFFPSKGSIPSFYTLIVFAVGYISRPLGGLLFGVLGDKFGRRKTFIYTVALMALSTLTIGLLPNYKSIGLASTILLICCRFLQGLSQGGEVPGAIIFVSEHAASNVRNKNCAFIFFGLGFGALLSSCTCYLLSNFLSKNEIVEWGWRIPFMFGGFLGIISIFIRKSIHETAYYVNLKKSGIEKKPISYLLKNCKKDLGSGILLVVLSSSLITFTLTFPIYINSFSKLDPSSLYLLMSFGMLTMSISVPLFGIIADNVGSTKLLKVSTTTSILIIPLSVCFAIHFGTFLSVLLMLIIIQGCIGALLGSFPVILANLFPAKVRYTGVAFSYNLASFIGSFIPAIIDYIVLSTNNPMYIGLIFSSIGVISLLYNSRIKLKDMLNLEGLRFAR